MPPVVVEAFLGVMATVIGFGVTVTTALAVVFPSATLVATTWKVPGVAGAV